MKPLKIPRREMEIAVISDVHLGTYGCHAEELLMYLKSIRPKVLILNGDIIDIWQFRKRYFPPAHLQVVRYLTGLMSKKVRVVYIPGNHDEMLRRFVKFSLGNFELVNKLVLEPDGKKAWFFHGDVFDVTMQNSRWLAKLGSVGYGMLILLNSTVNFLLTAVGKEKISFSKRIKEKVKSAVAYTSRFEETAAGIAISNGYDYVVCGHIHKAEKRIIRTKHGEVTYLNSGDWVENLTALEYNNGAWSVYRYQDDAYAKKFAEVEAQIGSFTDKELFDKLLKEMKIG